MPNTEHNPRDLAELAARRRARELHNDLLRWTVSYYDNDDDVLQHFVCHAGNYDHAVEQALNAYPDCEIIEVIN